MPLFGAHGVVVTTDERGGHAQLAGSAKRDVVTSMLMRRAGRSDTCTPSGAPEPASSLK